MSILESIYNHIKNNMTNYISHAVDNFSLSELPLNTPSAAILSLPGGNTRPLYIGGGKEVDFLFKILYKISNEDTASRIGVEEFFESLSEFLRNTQIDLGDGRTFIRCVQSSGCNKSTVNSGNVQEWTAEYTLTYQEL